MGLVLSFMVALKLSATRVIVEVKPANLPVSKHTGKADFSFFFLNEFSDHGEGRVLDPPCQPLHCLGRGQREDVLRPPNCPTVEWDRLVSPDSLSAGDEKIIKAGQ